jgi:hypothetical protein
MKLFLLLQSQPSHNKALQNKIKKIYASSNSMVKMIGLGDAVFCSGCVESVGSMGIY